MRLRKLLIALSLFCSLGAVGDPRQLCARLFQEFRSPGSAFSLLRPDEINKVLPALVALTVADMAEQTAKSVPGSTSGGRYEPLVISSTNPKDVLVGVPRRDGTTDDASVLVRPPEFGTETIWNELDSRGRLDLALNLEGQFRKGTYDHALVVDPSELRDAVINVLPMGGNAGFSPLLVLNAARQRKDAGVCRLGACAFAGLLIELGTPASDIRLVSGSNSKGERHRWVELRAGAGEPWQVFDPTPRSPPKTEAANLLYALGGSRAKGLRERFSHDLLESPPITEPDPHDQVDAAFLANLMARIRTTREEFDKKPE